MLRCVDAAPVGVISTGVVVCGVEGDVGARGVVVVELDLCLTVDGGVKNGVRGEVSGVKYTEDGVDGVAAKRLGVVVVDTEGVVVTVVVVVVVVTAVVVVCGVRGDGVAFCRRRNSARRCFSASEAL